MRIELISLIFSHFSDVDPLVLSFRFHFYPADPMRLSFNGKCMLFQQLKRDLIHGRLYCSAGEAAALGALIVQGKFLLIHSCELKRHYPINSLAGN
jgi:FERM domain-containing protein 3/5